MTTSTLERFRLGELELNTASGLVIESLTFTPAQKKPNWVTNNDADGDALVREAHYSNSTFEMSVRVAPAEDMDAALEALAKLTDAVQQCEREDGGLPLLWTPNGSETSYTAYALLGEHSEVPIDVTGDNAGWFFAAPVVKVKLACRPFLYGEERTAVEATESGAEPLQTLYVPEVGGDVPAKARLIVKDKSSQDRRFAQWGRDLVDSEENPALLITAESLVTEGFSGEAKTRSGAYGSEKVKRATAVSLATTIAGTGRIAHIGSYAVYLRVYSKSEASRFRISYRTGDGALIPLEWKEAPATSEFSDIYMGEVFFEEATLGTQASEIRIEQKASEGNPENDINYVTLLPTRASIRARGLVSVQSNKLLAYDNFDQTAGNLEGKTLPLGGTWAAVVKTGENGFKVNATSHVAERAKVSDSALNAGAYAWAGTTKSQNVSVSLRSLTFNSVEEVGKTRVGILARGASSESEKNWLGAFLIIGSSLLLKLAIIKRVSGTETVLNETTVSFLSKAKTLSLSVDANGNWSAALAYEGYVAEEIFGQDSALAAGGALAEGKVGIYDAWITATAGTRTYDGFEALGVDAAGRVCYSGREIEFNSQGTLRQDSSGAYDGQPDLVRGADFYLDPAGESGRINRLAFRMRRNDIEVEPDVNVTDKHTAEIKVTERYLLPR